MLFIKQIRTPKRDFILIHVLPTAVVFIALAGATVLNWRTSVQTQQKERQQAINQKITDTEQAIQARLKTYEEILRSGAGLFNASSSVEQSEWDEYIEAFNIPERYPGVRGVGYLPLVTNEARQNFVDTARLTTGNYDIFPTGDRPEYTPLLYIKSFTGSTSPNTALGFDMLSDPIRKVAMEHARDSGTAAISEKVNLLSATRQKGALGFLMFFPVYDKVISPGSTVPERRAHLRGYVYAPFRTNDLLVGIFGARPDSSFAFQIYESNTEPDNLLYQSQNYEELTRVNNHVQQISTLSVSNDSRWVIRYAVSPEILPAAQGNRPENALFGGVFLSALVAGFVFMLILSRSRSIAYAEERDIQQAKDDLLSLASHQLRTPATGVKQYLGMLQEGYAGKLSSRQEQLLEKAYESNERQLATIDQILHVARVTSGRIVLEYSKLELNSLVRKIAAEHQQSAKEKQQRFRVILPKRSIPLEADEAYLSIALDNLIGNAIKYTFQKGRITITTKSTKTEAFITVSDTGVGIPEHEQHLLFQKFSRLHNELTRQVSGSGVGLYLAKQIALLHNGDVTLNSTANKGSEFIISIPRHKPRD